MGLDEKRNIQHIIGQKQKYWSEGEIDNVGLGRNRNIHHGIDEKKEYKT